MKRALALFGLMGALPAQAQDFAYKGQWETRWPSGKYVGIVLIDSERRATWDSPNDQGRIAKFVGYVADLSDSNIALRMTDRDIVTTVNCDIRSKELLHCYIIRADKSQSANFLMVKVGPGPHRLTQSGQ